MLTKKPQNKTSSTIVSIIVDMFVIVCSDPDGTDCLHAAVTNKLKSVVESLCQRGASLDARDCSGETVLWQSLSDGSYEAADILVGLSSIYNINEFYQLKY